MNFYYLVILLVGQIMWATHSPSAFSQNVIQTFSDQLQAEGYKIEKIVSSAIPEKSSLIYNYHFSPIKSYKILAFSENTEVNDVDLFVENNLGNTIIADKHYHSSAALVFKPQESAEYVLSALLYSCLSDIRRYSCVMIIASK